MNLANCLEEMADFPAANTQYQAAFNLLQTLQQLGQLFPDAIKMIRNIADWYRHPQRPPQPDLSKAFELAQLGLDWLDSLLNRLSETATHFMLTQNLPLFQLATDLALALNQPVQAYLILERSKSRVLVEQMLRERAEPGIGVDENLRTQYRNLRQRLRSFSHALGTATPTDGHGDKTRLFTSTTRFDSHPEPIESRLQEQQALEQQLDQIRYQIAAQDAAFGEAIQPQPLTLEDLISLIPTETLVIAFEQRPDFLHLYALTSQGVASPLKIELSLLTVYEQAFQFQEAMRNSIRESRKTVDRLVPWLNVQLQAPLTELLTQYQPQHLILIPHVAWHLLPIHLVNIAAKPLVECYPLHYLPAMQVLRLIRERTAAQQQNGCIIANPTQDLTNAEQESETVYQRRGQIDQFLRGSDAHLSAVRQVLNQSQHGHFSCHGCFDTRLTHAGLSLADGLLSAKELFSSIRMDNPRLVVLSACETAQVEPTWADEYMGLSAGFLFAGAHNVLATQWPVEDQATRLLIEDFYQGLNAGLSPVLALQQAQRQLRQMTIEQIKARCPGQLVTRHYDHPYYWAGFVLIGDGE
jgi:CHAT domain-containing protein